MDQLILNAGKDTPRVHFNHKEGILELSGQSLSEDASLFYAPLLNWLQAYVSSNPAVTKLIFNLSYFNSSSAKQLLKILYELETIQKNGNTIEVLWKFPKGNSLLEERGNELEFLVDLPFKYEAH